MATISTHVLDTARGLPAEGVPIMLEALAAQPEDGNDWVKIGGGTTNADGRIASLLTDRTHLVAGVYRMTFDTFAYYQRFNTRSFYPMVRILFEVFEEGEYHHVPLLLSPWGYSTYRGS